MKELEQLLIVSEARYERQRRVLVKITAEETELRRELMRLSQMAHTADQHETAIDQMRAIGADLLWQSWVGRAKATLNMRLARLLAIKEYEQAKVRQAFGRTIAFNELIEQPKREQRKRRAQQSLSVAIDQTFSGQL